MIQKQTSGRVPEDRPASKATDPDLSAEGSCPYLHSDDHRCASRFSLDRIDQMFEVCLGPGMAGCFVYHRLHQERTREVNDRNPAGSPRLVNPTHEGQLLQLRPISS